jgi:micrococcal nuclease
VKLTILLLFAIFFVLLGCAQQLKQGTVTKVVDGDTLDVDGVRIRLALVNTPEISETGWAEATNFTTSLCPVGTIASYDEDSGQPQGSFGRTVAVVYCGGKNLNEELLRNGYAEILTRFCGKSEFAHEAWETGAAERLLFGKT